MRVNVEEARVLGSLIEKQLTTPQQYPLSLNSLKLACNQLSNREPVVDYDERTIEATLDSLKGLGVVRFALPSHGRSVVRYRQVLEEKLALDDRQLALIAELLLRGPQTAGELRSRTERMTAPGSPLEVESELEALSTRDDPLVRRLARRPGQKEDRWCELLSASEAATEPAPLAAVASVIETPSPEGAQTSPAEPTSLAALAGDVHVLRSELADLRAEFAALRARLGDLPSP